MKYIFSYLVLFAFVLQIGSRLAVLINFQVNKEYIVENLCENRDKPECCCEGSCQLAKELKKVEEAEGQTPADADKTKKEESENIALYCNALLEPRSKFSQNIVLISEIQFKLCKGFGLETFHPPGNFIS